MEREIRSCNDYEFLLLLLIRPLKIPIGNFKFPIGNFKFPIWKIWVSNWRFSRDHAGPLSWNASPSLNIGLSCWNTGRSWNAGQSWNAGLSLSRKLIMEGLARWPIIEQKANYGRQCWFENFKCWLVGTWCHWQEQATAKLVHTTSRL